MADESPADEPQLKVERDGNVVVLTMNNPRRKNASAAEPFAGQAVDCRCQRAMFGRWL